VLHTVDWAIIGAFFALALGLGIVVARRASRSSAEFFLSGRDMPWWLLGTSMVATTFAADTPLLVTSFVRTEGVAGNWRWWVFLLTGMLTVAVYAKLWRRCGLVTDNEFYELRYGGRPAALLRGFRAVYLGLVFNCLVMATVTVAAIKIGDVMFGFTAEQTILVAAGVTVVFSTLGGLTGVLITDFALFFISMLGSAGAAIVALGQPEVGGLSGLLSHPVVQTKLSLWPRIDFSTTEGLNTAMALLVIPLAVQWWASWYPGAEPGGGGYIAQRMLAAKNEAHATGATLFFNIAHYAIRPWPWILVALASLIVFPDLESIRAHLEHAGDGSIIREGMLKDDYAYPAMLQKLPPGLLGLVATSLIAAYMSTISTHLNWGSSYLVNDVWMRFVRPEATDKEAVLVGRLATVLLMTLVGVLALQLGGVDEGFEALLKVGAGTGLIYILRWFWWRVNALAEIVAMAVSFPVAAGMLLYGKAHPGVLPPDWVQFLIIVGITTASWVATCFLAPAETEDTLRAFYNRVRPGGPGWSAVLERAHADGQLLDCTGAWNLRGELLFMLAGCLTVYGMLMATGYTLYGMKVPATIAASVAVLGGLVMKRNWSRVASAPRPR
jgi:SSS family solute:Na+ symporter